MQKDQLETHPQQDKRRYTCTYGFTDLHVQRAGQLSGFITSAQYHLLLLGDNRWGPQKANLEFTMDSRLPNMMIALGLGVTVGALMWWAHFKN